jgi:hypothetical protein
MRDSAPKDPEQARGCPLGYDEETVTCSWRMFFFYVGVFVFCAACRHRRERKRFRLGQTPGYEDREN